MSDTSTAGKDFYKSDVLGHRSGLFILFFTEMWERFSFYGMRVLLVQFLTAPLLGLNPGWEWSVDKAMALFGTYAMSLYLTPIIGGILADQKLGYRNSVITGSILMTLGHVSLAFEKEWSMYLGLLLLVLGTGLFKPCMTSILSEMHKDAPEKKDGAYTIFYMGVNAGAFFGMGLCSYLAANVGWSYGFGFAGVFMLFGLFQFWLSKPLFGKIGDPPSKEHDSVMVIDSEGDESDIIDSSVHFEETKEADNNSNPFTLVDKVLTVISSAVGLLYVIYDLTLKVGGYDLVPFKMGDLKGIYVIALAGLVVFFVLVLSRISRYEQDLRNKMYAILIFALFTVIFWMAFEQGAGSLVLFARDYIQRELTGVYALMFNISNTLLYIIPLAIITYVLFKLWKATVKVIKWSNILLGVCFVIVWAVVVWMLQRNFGGDSVEIDPGWFSILNSFFIITFANMMSKIWEGPYNPSAPIKYGIGLILLALGFGVLAIGTAGDMTGVKVSMFWLVFAYLFHTLGELCISPVGLSYLSKLVPAKMIAFMFGMWYVAIAIGNKLAAQLGGMVEEIQNEFSLSGFFWLVTAFPFIAGIIVMLLNKPLKRLMGDVK